MITSPKKAREVFLAAIKLPADEQEAYLQEACGDDQDLHQRVAALLEAQAELGSYARPTHTEAEPFAETTATVIGPYKLVELIGEGGMGSVWMAQQTQPVKRLVAVKLIKPGMDSKQVIARFEAERQALALMDHPNIARVLDAGTIGLANDDWRLKIEGQEQAPSQSPITNHQSPMAGRPYFVMELVKGMPITKYCDEHHLTPRERLELFIPVCHAVQHAHQKGIIHRDLKPSNVLVALYDGKPVPKVIDFGVAKAAGQPLTDKTLVTGFGHLVGTLEYVSPEQAELNNLDVDTRTDIYALGVLLYELLTGSTPLSRSETASAGLMETLRIIREQEPLTPSKRLSTAAGLGALAANRGTAPAQLTRLVRGELDWIVMKALEKDRNRRYDSATGFAKDVERYLADEPVQACPPSTAYRLRKFLHRHRAATLAAAAVMLALLGGLAGTTWGMLRAEEQRQVAELNEGKALAAVAAEKEARESAQEREAEVQAVLDFVECRIFAAARPRRQSGGLGRDVTVQQAMDTAKARIAETFAGQPLIEARLRMTLGLSYAHLGDAKEAEAQCRRARALYAAKLGAHHPLTLSSIHNLAVCYRALGRHKEALQLNEETLALRRVHLPPDHPDTLKSMANLANDYHALDHHAKAWQLREEVFERYRTQHGPHHRQTLASMHNLAVSYVALDRHDEARRELYEQTLKLQEQHLGADHPDLLMTMQNLASCLGDLGHAEEALQLQEKTLQLKSALYGPDHPETLASANNLGAGLAKVGQHARALELLQRTLHLMKMRYGPDHPLTLGCTWNVAAALVDLGRDDEALPIIDDCVPRAIGKDVDPKLFSELLVRRVRICQKKQDAAGCRKTAEQWEKLKRTDAYGLFVAGRLRSVTATVTLGDAKDPSVEANRLAQAEADRAMAWLRRAVAARGFEHGEALRNHKDFDVLHNRADFKQLLTELEGDG